MTTKEKPEFCAGVKILVERMQTNPEDFGEGEFDMNSLRPKETKFGHLARLLDNMLTGRDKAKLLEGWAEWHYLSKEEQSALLDAYKQMRRSQFDKRIMERVFDENFYQRQEEAEMEERLLKQQMYQQQLRALQPQPTIQPGQFQIVATDNTSAATGSSLGMGSLGMGSLGLGLGGIFK